MAKINKKDFKRVAAGTGGVQAVVAKRLGVARQSINDFINKYPDMREVLDSEREKIIDMAENKLFVAANKGEKWAIDRILKTLGKNRGHTEKQEIEFSGEVAFQPTKIEIIMPEGYKDEVENNPNKEASPSVGKTPGPDN